MAEGDSQEPTKNQLPNPEDMAKSKKIADEMEKIGWRPLKPLTERFTVSSKDPNDPSKAAEERLGEVANTPPEELLKGSDWRRKLSSSAQENKPDLPPSSQVKPPNK